MVRTVASAYTLVYDDNDDVASLLVDFVETLRTGPIIANRFVPPIEDLSYFQGALRSGHAVSRVPISFPSDRWLDNRTVYLDSSDRASV